MFLKAFEKEPPVLADFDTASFNALCDHITVFGADDILVTFRGGQEIRGSIINVGVEIWRTLQISSFTPKEKTVEHKEQNL